MLSERELPQRKLVRVPDLVGLPLRKALIIVKHAGLRVGGVLCKESYEEKDTVLEQKPRRGQMVYATEEVSLWISRESYVRWLPAIYQRSDATGRNVVRDLLWLIQHMFGSIESQLDDLHQYFDSYETPEGFLPWLAAWSAMILEPDWPVNKKRRLIKKAMELYRLRGTVRGLKLFISLFTGFEPYISENEWPYQGLRIGVSSTVGVDTVILPPVAKEHAFVCVMPYQFKDVTAESIIRLHEIIEMEKPAHTHYMLKFEEPRVPVEEREFYRIGVTSGVNVRQEIVTPLPVSEETGEPIFPTEPTMPPQQSEPSVYDLFGTRKRQLPALASAPKADNAPVEGKEVTSSKFGFEGAREFRLDDIMKELLERAGMATEGSGTTVEVTATATPDSSTKAMPATESAAPAAPESPPKPESSAVVTTTVVGGRGAVKPKVEIDVEAQISESLAESEKQIAAAEARLAAKQGKTETAQPAASETPEPSGIGSRMDLAWDALAKGTEAEAQIAEAKAARAAQTPEVEVAVKSTPGSEAEAEVEAGSGERTAQKTIVVSGTEPGGSDDSHK